MAQMPQTIIVGAQSKHPTDSWWCVAPREGFTAYVYREHYDRMVGGALALEAKQYFAKKKFPSEAA